MSGDEVINSIKIWSTREQGISKKIKFINQVIKFLTFSPNSEQIAVAFESSFIEIFSMGGQSKEASFQAKTSEILMIRYSQDGKYLSCGGKDGTLQSWNIDIKQCIRIIEKAHGDWIAYIGYLKGDRGIVSVGYDKKIKVWEQFSCDHQRINKEESQESIE